MITEQEKKICEKFSKRDSRGQVRCRECPLRKEQGAYSFRCKANSHYDVKTREWEYD